MFQTVHTTPMLRGALASWLVRSTPQRASGPGSSPGRGHCVLFLGKGTLLSVSLSTKGV